MEFLGNFPIAGGLLIYIVPFLMVLTAVVFIHEFGHFIVARWCGVHVEVFSVGFGRELVGWTDRYGTRWKIAWIPLGGYVKMKGDRNESSVPDHDELASLSADERAKSFHGKALWQRAAVVAAGPIANFILSIVIFAATFAAIGQYVSEPRVDQVVPESPAAAAGIEPGDIIRAINGTDIENFNDLQRLVATSGGDPLDITLERGDARLTVTIVPRIEVVVDRLGNETPIPRLGIVRDASSGSQGEFRPVDPATAVWLGIKETWFIVDTTMSYLGRVLTGRESADQIGGPIRIAKISGQVAQVSWIALINLAAILSTSIGLINLFPVPMLDGGHLLFYAYEGVRGKPLGERAQEIGFKIGFVLVLSLMVFATWNDFIHLRVFDVISSFFS